MPSNAPTGRRIAWVAIVLLAGLTGGTLYWLTRPTQPGQQVQTTDTPTPAQPSEDRLKKIINAAAEKASQGDTPSAEAILKAALAEYPTSQDLHLAMAQVLLRNQDLPGVLASYDRALAIGPPKPEISFEAGNIAYMLGNMERAEELYSAAGAADPTKPEYPQALAQVYMKRNQLEEAAAAVMRSIKLDDSRGVAWGNLAEIALRQGRPQSALQHVAKARILEPRETVWRILEARADNRLGRAQAALDLVIGLPEAELYTPPIVRLIIESYGLLKQTDAAADFATKATDAKLADGDIAYEAALAAQRAGRPDDFRRYVLRGATAGHRGCKELAATLER